jgi:ABC-type methionine transport system permease subunit
MACINRNREVPRYVIVIIIIIIIILQGLGQWPVPVQKFNF